jgi:hypothetical protein
MCLTNKETALEQASPHQLVFYCTVCLNQMQRVGLLLDCRALMTQGMQQQAE